MNLIRTISLLLAGTTVTFPFPISAQEKMRTVDMSCLVSEEDSEGIWVASRSIVTTRRSIIEARDDYQWRPKKRILFGPGTSLKWGISYDWPNNVHVQKSIPENDVVVVLRFGIERLDGAEPLKNPQRSWLHLYRSADPEKEQTFHESSLIDVMFWQQFKNGNLSTKAVIPLDDLLAYGTGFETLVWNIRLEPDSYGGTHVLAKGMLPIASMRNKVSKIPKLRRLLDKKAANFQSECDIPRMAPLSG